MSFFARFLGSLYSQALYRRVRTEEHGYGARYSLFLFGFGLILSTYLIALNATEKMVLADIALIAAVAAVLRAAMLFALAIAARLTALRLKMPMDYPAGFRVAGLAYTPVAVTDAVVFCVFGHVIGPMLLFTLGVVMLLAVLHSTR